MGVKVEGQGSNNGNQIAHWDKFREQFASTRSQGMEQRENCKTAKTQ